jgi:site-specific DNA-methyltransferase (adenine-specific)
MTEHKPDLLSIFGALSPGWVVAADGTVEPRTPSPSGTEAPAASMPWPPRPAELADWPLAWRERWGRLANDLEARGAPFPDSEAEAFRRVKAEMEADAIAQKQNIVPISATARQRKRAVWEVTTGNCLDVMAQLERGSVNLVFADPPYNQGINYGEHHNDRMSPPEYRAWCLNWMRAAARLLTPDGSMFLLNRWEWADQSARLLKVAGLHVRQWIVWYETFGANCTTKYNRTSRLLIWCTKDPKRYTFNRSAVNRPSDRQSKYTDERANEAGKLWDDVWKISRVCGTFRERIAGFPTQLPLALLSPIVGAHSNRGDLVLDPFSGSGTTGEACVNLGRRFLGIELSAKFAELARQRLAKITPQFAGMS